MEKLHKIVNGGMVFLTQEEELQIIQEWEENELKNSQSLYIEQRLSEYLTLSEQLDMIYHQGLDVWKSKIKEIKDKYPKPS